jgi:hypothetical protein
MNRKAFQL